MTIETHNPPSHPNSYRCGTCRQHGHDRRNCPCTVVEATRLREEYNRERRQEAQRRRRELNQHTRSTDWRTEVYAQVVDMRRRLEELTGNGPPQQPPRNVPTVRERKIQEILFENAQKIPDGLYKELMDALVIRG